MDFGRLRLFETPLHESIPSDKILWFFKTFSSSSCKIYICKTAVMKIPKNCPQWNTERCLLRETLSMIFQFHLRVSHPSSLLRNSLGPLVFPPSASKNLLYCWDACIKPFEKKKNQQISTFSFPEFWKNQGAVFPYPKCPASECPGNGGTGC